MILPKVEVKKILYATDLSENARYAFAYAVSLADLYNASITFIHVLSEIPDLLDTNVIGYISEERWEEIKSQHVDEAREAIIGKRRDHMAIKDALHQFSENLKESQEGEGFVTDDIIVVRGNPVEEILKYSTEKNCDLIVMGTHGHGTLVDTMMGSTARRVLRRSQKPVLVVRLPEEDD
ncbi:MAG: universal stress protein [Desulfobacterales bacterium]|nr:universal stress protein [Desulfobacterales bacterium]